MKPANHFLLSQDLIAEYQGGEFSIFFANCEQQSAVSFDLRTELYNVKSNGKRDYLSIGEDALPTVYMVSRQICYKAALSHIIRLLSCVLERQ